MKILVVDDQAPITLFSKLELEDEGYNVVIANNGDEALRLFSEESPDLVTLDIKMSYDNEGLDILQKMKALNNAIPIILFSAFDFKDDFITWAADAYITKTSDMTELKDTIQKLLTRTPSANT